MNNSYPITSLKVGIIIFSLLSIIVTLFPPFEWNRIEQGIGWGGRVQQPNNDGVYYSYHFTSMKTYEFLFANNQKKFYSGEREKWMLFTRSIIITELLAEYLLAIFITILFYGLTYNSFKKNKLKE